MTKNVLFLGVSVNASLCAFTLEVKAVEPDSLVNSRRILSDPLLPPTYSRLDKLVLQNNGHIYLPHEEAVHDGGVYRVVESDMAPPLGDPPRTYMFGKSQIEVIKGQKVYLSSSVAQRNSESFIKRQFPKFFALGTRVDWRVLDPSRSSPYHKGTWGVFVDSKNEEGLPVVEMEIRVRDLDGKVVGFSYRPTDWPPHKVKFPQIKDATLKLIAQDKGITDANIQSVHIIESDLFPFREGLPKLLYRISITARNKASDEVVSTLVFFDTESALPVWINEKTGVSGPKKLVWKKNKTHQAKPLSDVLPTWTADGLVFVSERALQDMPSWAEFPSQSFLVNKIGDLSYLTSSLNENKGPEFTAGSGLSKWVLLQRHGWTYAHNISTGAYRVVGEPERPAVTPTISNDGKWAIAVINRRNGTGDSDLFADYLERSEKLALRGRIVLAGTDEGWPVFSSDNKWLYFIRVKHTQANSTQTLCRLPAEVVQSAKFKTLDEKQVETIAVLTDNVERLSIFPDGGKLLVQTDKGIQVVSIADKRVTPLAFAAQTDVEVGAPVTSPIDSWAGPTDDRVTFSGETKDKAGDVRRRIYSSRFDGSDLKAHTPKENKPVEQYIFPETKKTAYDLAKEWALGEIAYDDKRKERSN